MTELYPFVAVVDVASAVDFYVHAFGAEEDGERLVAPDGRSVAVLMGPGSSIRSATTGSSAGSSERRRAALSGGSIR